MKESKIDRPCNLYNNFATNAKKISLKFFFIKKFSVNKII